MNPAHHLGPPAAGRRRPPSPAAAGRLAALLAILVLAATGCGGSGGSDGSPSAGNSSSESSAASPSSSSSAAGGQDASAWADEVCTATSDWKQSIDTAQATLNDTANLSANGVRGALDDVATATDLLITDLTHVGTPGSAAAVQVQSELSLLATQLQQQKDTITGATSQSPTNARELLIQVSTITGALATMLTGITATVDNISQLNGTEELQSAFQTTPACQQLRTSASPSS